MVEVQTVLNAFSFLWTDYVAQGTWDNTKNDANYMFDKQTKAASAL